MINYYYDGMVDAYKQWQIALNTGKPKAAESHKKDYFNYKELYETRMESLGLEIEKI